MVSLIDALFIMPTALFAVGFIVPALVLSTDASEDFRQATSLGMADTVIHSFSMAFLEARKNNNSNLRQAGEVMSGRQRPMNWKLLRNHPEMFSYFRINFDSPLENPAPECNNIPGFLSYKSGYGGPCDFYLREYGSKEINKETKHFRVSVPVRGGRVGVMDVVYQVN